MTIKSLTALGFIALSSLLAPAARASTLIGDVISATYYYPTNTSVPTGQFSYSTSSFTVGAGIESILTINGIDIVDVDFAANSLTLTYVNTGNRTPATFNGPAFTVTSGNPFAPITSVVSPVGTTVLASFVGSTLEINWQGQHFAPGDSVVITFGSAVPEPSTWAMMLLGFAGIGTVTYRRRRAATGTA